MRIISKFVDYYDASQAHGMDKSLVFERQHEASHFDQPPPVKAAAFVEFAKALMPSRVDFDKRHHGHTLTRVDFGLALFAGRLYPFACVSVRDNRTYLFDETFVHSFEGLDAIAKSFGIDLIQRDVERKKSFLPSNRNSMAEFFTWSKSDRWRDDAIEQRLAIASHFTGQNTSQVNPRLADIGLYKVLDAYSAYQEITMFVGNLASPDRVPVTLTDKDRIQQHGFDDMSFRKLPQKHHR